MHKTLVTQLRKIKHSNHPYQGTARETMSPEVFALVSTTPWEILERMEELFVVLGTAITETDQRTEERMWIAMKTRETNNNNMNMCPVTIFVLVIPKV